MGDGTDGDQVDAGFGDRSDGFQADATGSFCQGSAGDELDGGAELVGRHVVEEDDVCTGLCGEAGLFEGVGFHFDPQVGKKASGAPDGGGDGVGQFGGEGGEVIVLDENHVPETDTVILATAAGDGVFLEGAPAGGGFPGVEDAGGGSPDGGDETVCGCGDAREVLDEIEGGAFGGQEGAGGTFDDQGGLAGGEVCAVSDAVGELDLGGNLGEGRDGEWGTSENKGFAGAQDRAGAGIGGDAGESGDIARPDVLAQGADDGIPGIHRVEVQHGGNRAEEGVTFKRRAGMREWSVPVAARDVRDGRLGILLSNDPVRAQKRAVKLWKKRGRIPLLLLVLAAVVGCVGHRMQGDGDAAAVSRRVGVPVRDTRPGELVIPAGVELRDGLGQGEAVTLALWNNAAFRELLVDLGLSHADLVQAKMLPDPTVSMLIPVGAKPLEMTLRYPMEVLWLRPGRVAVARLEQARVTERLVQAALDLVRDVKVAYAEVLLARDRRHWAEESTGLQERVAEAMRARVRAGDASPLDAVQAETEHALAMETLVRQRQEFRISSERLRQWVGMGLAEWVENDEGLAPMGEFPMTLEACVSRALAVRPDLRAAELGVESAGERMGLARKEAFTVSAGLNSKEIGTGAAKQLMTGPSLDVTLPLLNRNQGGVAQARARFEQASRRYYTVRDRILLEVREGYARWEQAHGNRRQWHERILPPLEQAVRQSERALAAGDVSPMTVTEVRRRWVDARFKAAGVDAEERRAMAELERSIGRELADNSSTRIP